ncbi:MAG: hypothetical protein IIZ38_03020 [Sphingomonas sp.]|uniref:hypothetical protein n=1 Tax=Sphingomonas sp. TaxID=28214 RepID=UPI0025F9CF5F|nr:hypothetical protein [Sphingomonas sp.]MBQ1497262.1 hypothetical protein [Sphingomonas sp.]
MKLPTIRWLAEPTRFAALGRARARIALAVLGLFLLLSLTALVTVGPPPVSGDPAKRADDQSDVVLYESIVAGVRHGGGYYEVAADALRAGNYPLRPFVTFRLPGLAMVQAHLPRLATMGLLYLLVAAVFAVWGSRLRAGMTRWPPVAIGLALLAAGLMAFVQPDLWAFHEIWAGLLVALSLGVRRPGRWIEAVAIALLAMLIRETAALFALVMLAAAWLEGQKREAIGWGVAIACLAVALGFHAWAVGQVTTGTDPASPGWAGLHGYGFFAKAMALSTALRLLPMALAALLVTLSLFGWIGWRDPAAGRVAGTLAAFGLAIALFARPDTFYWALMVAPLSLIGLAFAPDGLRDLFRQALDRRRITVTKVTR